MQTRMTPHKRKLQSGRSSYSGILILQLCEVSVVWKVAVVAAVGSLQLRSQQTDTLGEHGHQI